MNIYIKNTDGNIELLATKELVGRLNTQSNKPIVGMCITKEGIGTHCLFKNENGEMRIYLYETSTKTFLNVYYKLNADGNFDTTSNQSVSPPAGD